MIKIKLSGRPTARFYEELDSAIDGTFEYFVDTGCVLHLWVGTPSEKVREDEFRAAVQVHRTLDRSSHLDVAVRRALRNRGLSQRDETLVRRSYQRYKDLIDLLRSDMLFEKKPARVLS